VILSLPNPAVSSDGVFALLGWRSLSFRDPAHPFASTINSIESITTLGTPMAEIVPEPDTLALLGGALAVFAIFTLIRRKRRRK
jgi:hypothetical protein